MNHMLHGAVARIGGAIKRIEGADGAKYSLLMYPPCQCLFYACITLMLYLYYVKQNQHHDKTISNESQSLISMLYILFHAEINIKSILFYAAAYMGKD